MMWLRCRRCPCSASKPGKPLVSVLPHVARSAGPLKAAAEKLGKVDFTNLWAGQAVRMGREMPAAELTWALAGAALARMGPNGRLRAIFPRLRRKSGLCYTAGETPV
jgi:hypothetical protein